MPSNSGIFSYRSSPASADVIKSRRSASTTRDTKRFPLCCKQRWTGDTPKCALRLGWLGRRSQGCSSRRYFWSLIRPRARSLPSATCRLTRSSLATRLVRSSSHSAPASLTQCLFRRRGEVSDGDGRESVYCLGGSTQHCTDSSLLHGRSVLNGIEPRPKCRL